MTSQEISDFELFLNLKHLDILRELSGKEIVKADVRGIITLLDKLLIYFPYKRHQHSFEHLFRLVINRKIKDANVRLTHIGNLKYPPNKEKVEKYGRCNLPQQSILYASLMSMTALDEVKPKTEDLVTETVWKRKSSRALTFIPIFANQPTNEPMINPEKGIIIPFLTNMRTFEMNEQFEQEILSYPKNVRELCIKITHFFADCFQSG